MCLGCCGHFVIGVLTAAGFPNICCFWRIFLRVTQGTDEPIPAGPSIDKVTGSGVRAVGGGGVWG